tara:strand:+ start:85 stop:519 length:435 start_codon:yes stop_codon:yes gene_type:complete
MLDQEKKRQKWLKVYHNNRDVINERSKQYHKTNRKSQNLYKKSWLDLNPTQKEKARQRIKNWRLRNRQKVLFYGSLYRARKKRACPKWANLEKIKQIYLNCPIGYHVDHITPLTNKNVCGLHIENNLQYLTAIENQKKSNKFTV